MAIPNLDKLKAQLHVSGVQQTNNPLFQVISQLIDAVRQFQGHATTEINTSSGSISSLVGRTYITSTDETAFLINSRQLLAGTGITLDDSIPGDLTISSTAAVDGVWTPLTDGDPVETELIFDGFGNCIMVFEPNP